MTSIDMKCTQPEFIGTPGMPMVSAAIRVGLKQPNLLTVIAQGKQI